MRRSRNAGAALLAAMLTVALVATLAAGALWQQWRTLEVEAAERMRTQSAWILNGALDWARLILREDHRSGGSVDHLAEPWAVPLEEARLSTFLAADRQSSADPEGDNVFLSGQIADLQARLNVTSLIQAAVVQPEKLESFRRLFDLLGLPQQQLSRMVENLRFASDISAENRSGGRAALVPHRVEHLAWLGLSPEAAALLEPYVTVLPEPTPVNLNTARAEVIYAVGRGISMADAQRIVAERERRHFTKVANATLVLGLTKPPFEENAVSVNTRFMEVRGRLRIDAAVVEERSVVRRDGYDVRVVSRERAPTTLPGRGVGR